MKSTELGEIYTIDLWTGTVLADPIPIVPGYDIFGCTGRSHGARGITFHDGMMYVADSGKTLFKIDPDTFQIVDSITYPEFAGLHQIKSHHGLLHVVSTSNDRLFRLKDDEIVDEVYFGDWSSLIDGYSGRYNAPWGTGRLHCNSVGWDEEGNEYAVFHTNSMIFQLNTGTVFFHSEGEVWNPHDIMFHQGNIIINNTQRKTTGTIDPDTKEFTEIFAVTDEQQPDKVSCVTNSWGHTRTLVDMGDIIAVGSIPFKIHLLKLDRGTYRHFATHDLTNNPLQAIYDIALDPRDW